MLNATANMKAANELRETELGATTLKIPPTQIEGTPVRPDREPRQFRGGETWQTLVPEKRQVEGVVVDFRVWEFSLTTGRLVQTQF